MGKLLAIADLGQRAYGRWLFQRLLPGALMVVGFTIMLAIMGSVLLLTILVAAYYSLLYYGIGQLMAVMITVGLAVLIMALLVIFILAYLYRLRQTPKTLIKQSPLASHIVDTLDAFYDGLMAE